jgi:hypothetical protein
VKEFLPFLAKSALLLNLNHTCSNQQMLVMLRDDKTQLVSKLVQAAVQLLALVRRGLGIQTYVQSIITVHSPAQLCSTLLPCVERSVSSHPTRGLRGA